MKSPQISRVVFLENDMKKPKNLSGVFWWGINIKLKANLPRGG